MAVALLLDLDGTLMDTLEVILGAMDATARDFDIPRFGIQELRPMIGTPVQRQLEELRGIRGSRADAFTDRYYEHFARSVDAGLRLFPGVLETFPQISDRRIGTMSTRRREEARHMLRVTGLEPYFHAVVGGDDVSRPKPNPDLPLLASKALGVPPVACVVVGDSPVDIVAGRTAGCRTVAATYGYGGADALRGARPDAFLERFDRLPRILDLFDALAAHG